ncbi:unnamed protein product, partial [Symbiodinium sp. CCMP2456]
MGGKRLGWNQRGGHRQRDRQAWRGRHDFHLQSDWSRGEESWQEHGRWGWAGSESYPTVPNPQGAVPEDLRKLLEDVLGAVRQVAEEGDRADEVKQALAPLQQLLRPQQGEPKGDCQDPDLALARAFKTQAGVLRALGQRKLQGEHRVTQARAALQNHERQLQQLQEELVQAQVEMDRLAKQYSDQIVTRQLEPYGAGPMEDEGDMGIDSEMQDNIKALQGALQTDEQKQMLESLLRKCAHADLQHKRRIWQGCGLGSKGPDLEDITRCQISTSTFWLQFSLAWQLGRGLLGMACRQDIQDLCMQLLMEPSLALLERLRAECHVQPSSAAQCQHSSVVEQLQPCGIVTAPGTDRKGDLADPVNSCSEAARDLTLLFANITSWSRAARTFLLEQGVQCLLVAEHHQVGSNLDLLKQQCVESGWKGSYSPAAPSDAGGTRAGVFAVARKHLNPVDEFQGVHPRWNSIFIRRKGCDLLLLVAYFKNGGLHQEENYELMRELLAAVHSVTCPWVIAADFNLAPQVLFESGFARKLQGVIVDAKMPTIATGSELDYLIVSKSLQGCVEVAVDHMVPFRPHYGLRVTLKGRWQQALVPALNTIDPVPGAFGPRRPWEHFGTTDGSFQILGCLAKTSEQQTITEEFARWSRQAEAYLLDVSVEPVAKGRGTFLEYGTRPHLEAKPAHNKWDSSDLNYWCGLRRLVGDLMLPRRPVPLSLQRRLHKVMEEQAALMSKYWWPEFDAWCTVENMRHMLLSFQRVERLYGAKAMECLQHFVGLLIEKRRAFYRQKFADGLLTPKQMHAYLRPAERRKYWVQIWGDAQWPVPLTVVGYALLPKNAESERPIALTSLWYRVLIKSRLHLLEAWLKQVAPLCPWDRAVVGSTVFCSSMARMLRAEILPHAQLYQVSVLVDLKHCYDQMNIQILLRAALKRQYPPGLLALAVPVHCGVRVLMAENMHSQFIQPLKGILAGCSLSVSLAKLYLWDVMEALQVSAGLVASDTWVDDLSFDLVDYNPERLAQRAVALYEDLADQVDNIELQISVKKSGFLASHVAVATPLKRLVQAAQH